MFNHTFLDGCADSSNWFDTGSQTTVESVKSV